MTRFATVIWALAVAGPAIAQGNSDKAPVGPEDCDVCFPGEPGVSLEDILEGRVSLDHIFYATPFPCKPLASPFVNIGLGPPDDEPLSLLEMVEEQLRLIEEYARCSAPDDSAYAACQAGQRALVCCFPAIPEEPPDADALNEVCQGIDDINLAVQQLLAESILDECLGQRLYFLESFIQTWILPECELQEAPMDNDQPAPEFDLNP